MSTPVVRRTRTSLSAESRLYTTHVANSVVAGMVKGSVFGMISGMAIRIWPGDSPFWLASWTSPARRNIPVRATSDIRKTLTSSARIIRLMMPKYTGGLRSLRGPAEQPADRLGDHRERFLTDLRRLVAPEVSGHADAIQAAAQPGGQVTAPAQNATDVRPHRVELEAGIATVQVHLPLPPEADGVAQQVELADLESVAANAEHRVRFLERRVVHGPQPGELDHIQHDRQVEHSPTWHVNAPAPFEHRQARDRVGRVRQVELGIGQPLQLGFRAEVVGLGKLFQLQSRRIQGQVEPDRGPDLETSLAADFAAIHATVDPRDGDDVGHGRVHLESGRHGLDRLLHHPSLVHDQVADHPPEAVADVQSARLQVAGE